MKEFLACSLSTISFNLNCLDSNQLDAYTLNHGDETLSSCSPAFLPFPLFQFHKSGMVVHYESTGYCT